MTRVQKIVDVDVPARNAYNFWTQFEQIPQFMDGIEEVRQLDPARLHWVANVRGIRRERDAQIIEQVPDELISWQSVNMSAHEEHVEADHTGTVRFERLSPTRTRVTLDVTYRPHGMAEQLADKLGLIEQRLTDDLARFAHLVQSGSEGLTGWRGEIRDGQLIERPDEPVSSEGLTPAQYEQAAAPESPALHLSAAS